MDAFHFLLAALLVVAVVLLFLRRASPDQAPVGSKLDQMTGRLDALDRRFEGSVGQSVTETSRTLGAIRERLDVIDQAQGKITELSSRILTLQDILSDKQTRGAFGEERMQAIVEDQLPRELYDWQKPLSNGSRPDCLIHISKGQPPLAVDSKFPLEGFERFRAAQTDEERKSASVSFKNDAIKHVRDISRKYLISGETQPVALMFIPSESIYAEMHASFPDVIREGRRCQVIIVPPHIFMLAVNMVQTLVRDASMREQAHVVQKEVRLLLDDVGRLGLRVGNLRSHFDNAAKDVGEIETSMKKITSRSESIEQVRLTDDPGGGAEGPPAS